MDPVEGGRRHEKYDVGSDPPTRTPIVAFRVLIDEMWCTAGLAAPAGWNPLSLTGSDSSTYLPMYLRFSLSHAQEERGSWISPELLRRLFALHTPCGRTTQKL